MALHRYGVCALPKFISILPTLSLHGRGAGGLSDSPPAKVALGSKEEAEARRRRAEKERNSCLKGSKVVTHAAAAPMHLTAYFRTCGPLCIPRITSRPLFSLLYHLVLPRGLGGTDSFKTWLFSTPFRPHHFYPFFSDKPTHNVCLIHF